MAHVVLICEFEGLEMNYVDRKLQSKYLQVACTVNTVTRAETCITWLVHDWMRLGLDSTSSTLDIYLVHMSKVEIECDHSFFWTITSNLGIGM